MGRSSSSDVGGTGVLHCQACQAFQASAGERRWQEPREDLRGSVVPRKSLSKERAAPTPDPAPLRSSRLCTRPASAPRPPRAGANLDEGRLPPLRLAAVGLREAWVTPPAAAVMARERCLPRRARPCSALDGTWTLSLRSKDQSKRPRQGERGSARPKEESPSPRSQLAPGLGPTPPRE